GEPGAARPPGSAAGPRPAAHDRPPHGAAGGGRLRRPAPGPQQRVPVRAVRRDTPHRPGRTRGDDQAGHGRAGRRPRAARLPAALTGSERPPGQDHRVHGQGLGGDRGGARRLPQLRGRPREPHRCHPAPAAPADAARDPGL
ncbi:MAG: Transcriptional regulator, MarR family, partial [uncultured Acidimicrobiales bacterium]